MQKNSRVRKAFSLLELSMSLLIIGFITIAIATSKNIYNTAKLTRARALTNSSVVSGINNLNLWLETTSTKSFSTEDPLDQDTISTWYDLNPQLTKNNATAGDAPTYIRFGSNGLPLLRFNGTSNYLNFDGTFLANTNYTVFLVEQRRSSNTNFIFGGSGVALNTRFSFGYGSSTLVRFSQFTNNLDYTITAYSSPVLRIHVAINNSSSGKSYYLNGTLAASNSETTPLSSNAGAVIGLRDGVYYYGDIAEIIMFNRALSAFERQQVEQYLSAKWGIKLS